MQREIAFIREHHKLYTDWCVRNGYLRPFPEDIDNLKKDYLNELEAYYKQGYADGEAMGIKKGESIHDIP